MTLRGLWIRLKASLRFSFIKKNIRKSSETKRELEHRETKRKEKKKK